MVWQQCYCPENEARSVHNALSVDCKAISCRISGINLLCPNCPNHRERELLKIPQMPFGCLNP